MIVEVLKDVLRSLYSHFGNALLLTFLFMFFYERIQANGLQKSISEFFVKLRTDVDFRNATFLALYTFMILSRTILARSYWQDHPLKNIIGIWTLHTSDGLLYTENIDNVILFVPFSFLVLRLKKYSDSTDFSAAALLKKGTKLAFVFSIGIEFLQLFFKLGTFQLSDIFFNTFGGMLGGIVYLGAKKVHERLSK
jgi:glycopeptide antibiotics resistance protein